MALDLFMIGLMVQDMAEALTFYRRLGLDVPDGSENETHVQIKMGTGPHTPPASACVSPWWKIPTATPFCFPVIWEPERDPADETAVVYYHYPEPPRSRSRSSSAAA
jgi:hypothetical protein